MLIAPDSVLQGVTSWHVAMAHNACLYLYKKQWGCHLPDEDGGPGCMGGWSEAVATSILLAGSLCTLGELHPLPGDTYLAPSSLWLQPCWQRWALALPWMLLMQACLAQGCLCQAELWLS